MLPGGAETGKRLLEDYRVAMVTFSGSRGGFGPRIEEMGFTFADLFVCKVICRGGQRGGEPVPVSVGQQQQCGEPEEALPGRGGQAWPARRHGGHGRPGEGHVH